MNQLQPPSYGYDPPTAGATAAISLNSTKFHPPVSSRGGVPREALLATLEQQSNVHLVLLLAPAGYGKTTLMGQWIDRIRERRFHASWLTLDEADNDPARLMCYLYGALREWMLASLGSDDAALFASSDWMSVLDRIGPDAAPLTLFFDEFEQLNSAPALRVVKLLVERLPRQVRLVISSRDKPALGLERYRVRGELLELTASDLRFDAAETARFFSGRIAEPLGSWTVEKMQAITDGWPAALQLTALAARTRSELERYADDLGGSRAHIADYLAEDVLNAQTPEVRTFLLETCAFPRLSAAACNAATARNDSQRMLQYLERHGLFTAPTDSSRNWYRYHPLFAEFLQSQQTHSLAPQHVQELHRSAARWFSRYGTTIEAVDLWLLAGDHAAAMREMTGCARELVMQAQFDIILRWLDRLNDAALESAGPELALAAAWACGFSGKTEVALHWLGRLKPALEAGTGHSALHDELIALESVLMALCGNTQCALASGLAQWDRIGKGHRFAAGALANVISYCLMLEGDFARARSFSDQARLCNEEIGSALGLGYAMSVSGLIEAIQGNLDRALDQCREIGKMAAIRLRQPWFDPSHVNVASVGLIAGVLYEKDRLDEADELLQRYLPLIMHQPSVDMQLFSHIVRARVKVAQSDPDGALSALEQVERSGPVVLRAQRVIEWERVRIDLHTGHIEDALARAAMLERADAAAAGPRDYSYVEELFGGSMESIRCAIMRGSVPLAMERLEQAIAQASAEGRRWRLLKLMLLRVLAFDAAGARDAARTELLQALRLGADIGARRSFAENGKRIAAILTELSPQMLAAVPDADVLTSYWRDLCGELPVRSKPAVVSDIQLSERERAILKMLATGMGNEQLAKAVYLSVNTVKWHIRRILDKLEARNRSEAVFIARNRGLIDF